LRGNLAEGGYWRAVVFNFATGLVGAAIGVYPESALFHAGDRAFA
jgi:hypothetical protein